MTGIRIHLTAAIGLMGLAVGYLAQRSRMCFIAGFRDYILVRDRELLLGFFSFFLTIWLLTTVFYSLDLLKKGAPEYGEPAAARVIGNDPPAAIVSGTAAVTAPRETTGSEYGTAAAAGSGSASCGGTAGDVPHATRALHFLSAPFVPDRFVYVSLAGGWIVGILSTFAGGCVLRQHVLAAQGDRDASWYLAGFYAAVPVFYLLLSRLVNSVY